MGSARAWLASFGMTEPRRATRHAGYRRSRFSAEAVIYTDETDRFLP